MRKTFEVWPESSRLATRGEENGHKSRKARSVWRPLDSAWVNTICGCGWFSFFFLLLPYLLDLERKVRRSSTERRGMNG